MTGTWSDLSGRPKAQTAPCSRAAGRRWTEALRPGHAVRSQPLPAHSDEPVLDQPARSYLLHADNLVAQVELGELEGLAPSYTSA